MTDKCPYCKAAFKDDLGYGIRYDCRSIVYKKGKPKESGFCQGRQQARSELSKEIAERLHDSLGDLCNKYEIYSSDDQFWIIHKVIGIGRFILREMANGSIWVADKDSGEGGEFSIPMLESAIEMVYEDNI